MKNILPQSFPLLPLMITIIIIALLDSALAYSLSRQGEIICRRTKHDPRVCGKSWIRFLSQQPLMCVLLSSTSTLLYSSTCTPLPFFPCLQRVPGNRRRLTAPRLLSCFSLITSHVSCLPSLCRAYQRYCPVAQISCHCLNSTRIRII